MQPTSDQDNFSDLEDMRDRKNSLIGFDNLQQLQALEEKQTSNIYEYKPHHQNQDFVQTQEQWPSEEFVDEQRPRNFSVGETHGQIYQAEPTSAEQVFQNEFYDEQKFGTDQRSDDDMKQLLQEEFDEGHHFNQIEDPVDDDEEVNPLDQAHYGENNSEDN